MNKKSQFYMFAAIIFITAVVLIISNDSDVNFQRVRNLENLHENYLYEARNVLNNAAYKNKNLTYELMNFTENFIDYASDKDLNIGIVNIFTWDNKIIAVNYLKGPVLISSTQLQPGSTKSLDFSSTVTLRYEGETYDYDFEKSKKTHLKTLFVKE